ncbi:MAG: tRNA (adenosine(37)-N6)-threonylcarbamoyltransferase complex transferase subunit TsaD [Rhodospirillales bacterium]|nr:tRNA (adenosine(37)-N6)-threonylcarbamoyltransferase complex transferase subunit TsaD [Rhodospirillales bacterium]
MLVLGIETSCDETAVALVDEERRLHANLVLSQIAEHRPFGGVVPEIAARAHLEQLAPLLTRALEEAGFGFGDLDGIAATSGPGLIGGIFVGAVMAKALAAARSLPFLAVNHLEGHALTVRLTHDQAFPYLLLLLSGGHCQLVAVDGLGRYRCYGGTLDDAVGEAFDKTAKLLGLGYPGGPRVERAASTGVPTRFALPRPLLGRSELNFSFAGLKTAVRRYAENLVPEDSQGRADLAASFQAAVAEVLADRAERALLRFREETGVAGPLVVAGGVAANQVLRDALAATAEAAGTSLVAPPPRLCTDNAAMIAWAGLERLRLGWTSPLDTPARPRWPLESLTAEETS